MAPNSIPDRLRGTQMFVAQNKRGKQMNCSVVKAMGKVIMVKKKKKSYQHDTLFYYKTTKKFIEKKYTVCICVYICVHMHMCW